jgi:hypothetical protein
LKIEEITINVNSIVSLQVNVLFIGCSYLSYFCIKREREWERGTLILLVIEVNYVPFVTLQILLSEIYNFLFFIQPLYPTLYL